MKEVKKVKVISCGKDGKTVEVIVRNETKHLQKKGKNYTDKEGITYKI